VDVVGNNLDSVTPVPPPIEAAPRFSDVLRAGLVMGVASSLVCWLLFGIARLFGTDFLVRQGGGDGDLTRIWWWQVLLVPVTAALIFSLLATALRKRPNCRRLTLITGGALFVLTLMPVLFQPSGVTWPTRIWLVILHVVTALIVVPQVARVVGDSDPAVTAGHRRVGLEAL
jgi:Na+/melibiose symporter-like transporter